MPVFETYHRQSLKQEPRVTMIGRWRVDYLAFAGPEGCTADPLIVLGGAFQNFNSYKFCVEEVLQVVPVILIDLPSLGNNSQLAPELGLEDLADLLFQWVEHEGLDRVSVMGLSLGSVVAGTYAFKHPDRIDRLILTGTLTRPRKSWRMLLEVSLKVLDEGRMDEFGQAVVLYLVNHARLKETGISDITRRLFHRQMKNFSENEQARYRINANRLLQVEEVLGYPSCKTLVATGDYDSFTLPYENALYATRCPNATFALVRGSDHVPQLERREESVSMFSAFLRNEDVGTVPGIDTLTRDECLNMDRRGELRYRPRNQAGQVVSFSHLDGMPQIDSSVEIVDFNFFGCLLRHEQPLLSVREHTLDLILCLPDSPLRIETMVIDQGDGWLRCFFLHGNFAIAEELKRLLDNPDYCTPLPHTGVRPTGAP
jgi:pimeloyl-ACP methyl ester carboxylesterase